MKKLTASTSDAEVRGESILGYVNAIESTTIIPILEAHGLYDVEEHEWYSHQTILNVLRDIEEQKHNVSQSMVSIGMKIMELASVPPSVDSIPAALESLGVVYHLHHRNVTERGWYVSLSEPGHIVVSHDSPYPEDLAYGIVWAASKRFRPSGTDFTVRPLKGENENKPFQYDVTWG
jgi:hypothetical protein